MSKKKSTVRQAVRFSLIAAATASVAYTAPAFAQQAPSLDTVVVTGSRIAKRDAIAESPILTVDSAAIETSGFVAVEQFLNTLPQVTPGISSQSNNPSSNGRAFLDLRGLGSNRNLVLIDGRRGMGSTGGGVVDINTIPAALIDRTEIITGGAAAVYGADAIAGVVNFILKKNFEGVQIDGGYNITEEGDGMQWNTDITLGGTFADGRGSAVFNVGYYKRDDLYKGARKFSAQASSATGTFPGGGWTTGVNTPSQAAVDAAFGPGACALTAVVQASSSTPMARCSARACRAVRWMWSVTPAPTAGSRPGSIRTFSPTTSSRITSSCCRWSAGVSSLAPSTR